jgi:hypothetical protein
MIYIVYEMYVYLRKHCGNTHRPRIEPKVLGETTTAIIEQNRMRAHLRCEVDSKLTGEVLYGYTRMLCSTVLLYSFN